MGRAGAGGWQGVPAVKVLVTGASGMLGAAVARTLATRGDTVTVMQRRPAGLDLAEVLGDVADSDAVCRAAAGQDAVVHLAARVNVTGPWAEFERANVTGTSSVVAGCLAEDVGRLVHVSTPSVAHLGSSLVGAPAGAADPTGARGNYARSKAIAEQIALAAAGDLAVVAIRPHLVWGPGDTQLVGRLVERAKAGRLPIIGSGAALVDTTYVTNAADALVAALDRCTDVSGRALVVSNGEPRPVAELLSDICIAAGVVPPSRHVPAFLASAVGAVAEAVWSGRLTGTRSERVAQDPPITRFVAGQLSTAHWFDQRETRSALRWTPRLTLDEGLVELTRWYADPS
jgi:nucleoside-diphosphate-sugar epimerase